MVLDRLRGTDKETVNQIGPLAKTQLSFMIFWVALPSPRRWGQK